MGKPKTVDATCAQCAEHFMAPLNNVRRGQGRFCSVLCKSIASRREAAAGMVFGRLTLVERLPGKDSSWLCRCACGNSKVVRGCNLRAGNTTSCGCYRKECRTSHGATVGYRKTGANQSWHAMKQRCQNPSNPNFNDYGGRGITVCERWQDFPNFLADMGERPSGMTLDRINNDGNYEPSNCRWATRKQQSVNRRRVIHVTMHGRSQCLSDWARELGIHYPRLKGMVYRGDEPTAAIQQLVSERAK